MTTIVGMHVPGRGTFIGSDRQAIINNLRIVGVDKWVQHGEWAVGATGLMLNLNLIQENASALLSKLTSPRAFAKRLRKLLIDNHVGPEKGDDEGCGPNIEFWNHSILLASPDGLWDISSEMVCQEIRPNTLWALGSGQAFALGAGRAALEITGVPETAVVAAVTSAIHFDINSGGEPFYAHLGSKK